MDYSGIRRPYRQDKPTHQLERDAEEREAICLSQLQATMVWSFVTVSHCVEQACRTGQACILLAGFTRSM